MNELLNMLEGSCANDKTLSVDEEPVEVPKASSLEQVRGLLAEKSRSGYRAEVKALLTAHGVERLSDISDPAELGKLLEEATQIGAP